MQSRDKSSEEEIRVRHEWKARARYRIFEPRNAASNSAGPGDRSFPSPGSPAIRFEQPEAGVPVFLIKFIGIVAAGGWDDVDSDNAMVLDLRHGALSMPGALGCTKDDFAGPRRRWWLGKMPLGSRAPKLRLHYQRRRVFPHLWQEDSKAVPNRRAVEGGFFAIVQPANSTIGSSLRLQWPHIRPARIRIRPVVFAERFLLRPRLVQSVAVVEHTALHHELNVIRVVDVVERVCV